VGASNLIDKFTSVAKMSLSTVTAVSDKVLECHLASRGPSTSTTAEALVFLPGGKAA